ncbi:hypothetical protein [Tardiphaga sp. 839_C3_N1_4]|uniref:hypothetical protein n=1 Tax=Tardiphaga sp. 839_C3_N1_4 TaxID=3240761 RepID=UPI003F2675D8
MAKRIQNGQVALLRFELTRGNAKRIKVALQDVCALYRKGFILSSDQVNDVETIVNGIVLRDGQDLKVVRWCLNALAQFGRLNSCRLAASTRSILISDHPTLVDQAPERQRRRRPCDERQRAEDAQPVAVGLGTEDGERQRPARNSQMPFPAP